MRFGKPAIIASLALGLGAGGALAKPRPSHPKPDAGPSLQATLDFIVQKMNQQGAVNTAIQVHNPVNNSDWTGQMSYQMTNATASVGNCIISAHSKITWNGNVQEDVDVGTDLRHVKSIKYFTGEQEQALANVANGNAGWSLQDTPAIYVIHVMRDDGGFNRYPFNDEDTANSVGKAFEHAVKLCGGVKKDLF